MQHFRRYIIAGLLFWLPIVITYVIIKFLINLLDGTLDLIPQKYQPDQLLGIHIPGLGLVFTIIIIFVTGILVTNFIGHQLLKLWERLVSRIPLIRSIHSAVRQVLHAILQPNGTSFRKVLLVEYPRKGMWSIAFQTSEKFHPGSFNEPMLTIFIPTTPNPTSGFLMVIPKKDTQEIDMTIEDALRMVISLGVVTPEKMQAIEAAEKAVK